MLRKNVIPMGVVFAGSLALASGAALAASPKQQPDDSWVSVSGIIQSATEDAFVLGYDDRQILIEMDKESRFSEADWLEEGNRVDVYGQMDDDFFERPSIEAYSVYGYDTGSYYFSSEADDDMEATMVTYLLTPPASFKEGDTVTVSGQVTAMESGEFMLSTAAGSIEVDVSGLSDNPLDAEGTRHIRAGDYVAVTGPVDDGLFSAKEINADAVVVLVDTNVLAAN